MYNLTALLEHWNKEHPENKKMLFDYLRLKSTKELMNEIAKTHNGNSLNGDNQ